MRYQLQSEHGNINFRPQYFTEAIKILITEVDKNDWASGGVITADKKDIIQ